LLRVARSDITIAFHGGHADGAIGSQDIESSVEVRLQRRAKRHGRSMEEEVCDILRDAANEEDAPTGGRGTKISHLFTRVVLLRYSRTASDVKLSRQCLSHDYFRHERSLSPDASDA
jgi:plasmid stability protein